METALRTFLLLLFFLGLPSIGFSQETVIQEWTSLVQEIPLETDRERKFAVKAAVKVLLDKGDKISGAGVWARIDNKGSNSGFFENMMDNPIRDRIWKDYLIEGVFDKEAESLKFGALAYGNAKFYFDDFEVFIENEQGEFEKIPINNPGFESKQSTKSRIDGWEEGISPNEPFIAFGYKIELSDDANQGKNSILITKPLNIE